jgi:hypothetical protein
LGDGTFQVLPVPYKQSFSKVHTKSPTTQVTKTIAKSTITVAGFQGVTVTIYTTESDTLTNFYTSTSTNVEVDSTTLTNTETDRATITNTQ